MNARSKQLNRSRCGFTLTEVLIGAMFTTMMLGLLFSVTQQALRLATKVDRHSSMSLAAKTSMERIVSDTARADSVLTKYPPTSPQFTSSDLNTIVLRLPKFTADGVAVLGEYEVVAYQLETNADGTKDLVRYVANVSGANTPAAVKDRVVGKNVATFAMSYSATQEFVSNGSQSTWGLRGNAIAEDAYSPNQIMINGVNWAQQGFGKFGASNISFERAPKANALIDVAYRIAPEVSINSWGANAANIVNYRLVLNASWGTADHKKASQPLELNTRVEMKNAFGD